MVQRMSALEICPNCGAEITANAKFCRFCGFPIKRKTSNSSRVAVTRTQESSFPKTPQSSVTSQSEKTLQIERPPQEVLDLLYGRTRQQEISLEVKTALSELDKIKQKIEIGLIEQEEADEKIDAIKEKILQLKNEKAALKSGTLPVEEYVKKYQDLHEKLEKLENLYRSGQIQHQDIYLEKKKEYQEKISKILSDIRKERQKVEIWLTLLREDYDNIEKGIEKLKVSLNLDEITKEEYEEKLKDYSAQKEKLQKVLKELKRIYDTLP